MVGRPTTSDCTNILSLSVVANVQLPAAALPQRPLLSAHINEAIIEAFRRIMGTQSGASRPHLAFTGIAGFLRECWPAAADASTAGLPSV